MSNKQDKALNESMKGCASAFGNIKVRDSHEKFAKAWAAAGYPKHFQWSRITGRIWTPAAMRENLEFKAKSMAEQKTLIAERALRVQKRNLEAR